MKKTSIRTVILLSALAMIFTFASSSLAQKVGGYRVIDKADAGAIAAARFAVKTQADKTHRSIELISIFKAERQVVAGSNYRLCLKVTSEGEKDEADVAHFVQAVVYVDLKRNSKLTSWKMSDCDEDDDD